MSPIITMQKRLRQAGRIRIGAKVATSKGGTRPGKLESFRFTSPDRSAIEAVAEAFGGEVQPWNDAPTSSQWEVFTKATDFDVIVPSSDIAFSQFYEHWSGGGCLKRCDGVTEMISDSPCSCESENPICKPTTRLSVILAAIDGIGVWRLESHGFNSAAELSGSIEVLKAIQARNGAMVHGRLMLEQRQSKQIDPETKKPTTFNYAVPVLDFKVNVAAIASGDSQRTAIGVTPIHSELPPAPSVADQIAAASTPQERPKRSNAAAPLPSTGLKPRGLSTKPEVVEEPTSPVATDRTEGGASQRSLKRLMAILNGKKLDDDARHVWARTVLGFEPDTPISFSKLTQSEISKLNDAAETAGTVAPVATTVGSYTGTLDGQEPF